tara:strand:+ start:154 stop:483 length:330 start_codon:yes stop_codon:yes gene_type:complete
MENNLHLQKCIPCTKKTPKLTTVEIEKFKSQISSNWSVINNHHLHKSFKLKNFIEALSLTNKIGSVSETAGHHPNISLTWGKVDIMIYTHLIDGLSESDFILAAKIDQL